MLLESPTSEEPSPPMYAVPAIPVFQENIFSYHPTYVPVEPVFFIHSSPKPHHSPSLSGYERPMMAELSVPTSDPLEEEIDVETVETEETAADQLKKRLKVDQSEGTSSLTNLEPVNQYARPPSRAGSKSPGSDDNRSDTQSGRLTHSERYSSDEDPDLNRFTPRNSLRQIEEHGQYDASKESGRKFKCQYCTKRFVRKEEKLRHERSHTNDRKYKCRICNLRFLRADHRKGHEETHSDIKRFKCEPCNKSFRRKDEFNRHCQRKICKANKIKNEK